MTVFNRTRTTVLTLILFGALLACENQAERESAIRQAPHMLLPSNARMVFGLKPRIVTANPIIHQLRAGVGRAEEPLMFTRAAQLLGLTPRRHLDEMIYGLYRFENGQALFGLVAVGDFEEQDLFSRAEASISGRAGLSGVSIKEYQGVRYAAIGSVNEGRAYALYVAVPAKGLALASNNEAIIQKGAAIWLGRADSVSADPLLAPLLSKANLQAPIWVAGLSEGSLDQISVVAGLFAAESLGRGVDSYYGHATLSPDKVEGSISFACSSSDSAQRQAGNFKDIISGYAMNIVRRLGPGAKLLADKIQVEPQGANIEMRVSATAEEAETISQEFQQALLSPMQPDDLIQEAARRALRNAERTSRPTPATEESPAPEPATQDEPVEE